jgi:hypothetical protein
MNGEESVVVDPTLNFDVTVREAAEQLDKDGIICLEDVVSPEWLELARESVQSYLAANGEHDSVVYRPGDERNSPAHQIVQDPKVQALVKRLTAAGCPEASNDNRSIHSVLRVLAGPVREERETMFHYDASTLTIIIPIYIPEGVRGFSGELVVFPNGRPFRRFVISNILDKVLTQNRLYRWRLMRLFNRKPEKYLVQMKPGSVYLFWGYRTMHGNLPCAPDKLRVTLLLHYGDPHGGSLALAAAKSLSLAMRRRSTKLSSSNLAAKQAS